MMANQADSPPPLDGIQNAEALFVQVSKNFRQALSPQDKSLFKEFDSPTSMICKLRADVEQRQSNGKLSSLCRRIEQLSTSLGPFFDVVNIFVSSNPEISALAWGAIRFIFLLGSNYTLFLEKLIVMLERICQRLPGYSEYHERIVARHKSEGLPTSTSDKSLRRGRIVKTLSYIYADIIEFCQDASKIFATKRHGLRYKAAAIADIFWRPFDVRFAAILDKLQSHQDLFQAEMHLEESLYIEQQLQKREIDNETTGETLKSVQNELKELNETIRKLEIVVADKCLRDKQPLASQAHNTTRSLLGNIKFWINSPDYMRQYEKARSLRLGGTGAWFINSERYKDFKSFQSKSVDDNSGPISLIDAKTILFVKGKPGYGKTILSQILIDDLKSNYETDLRFDLPRQHVLFYHFDSERLDYCAPTHAVRAVLLQLLHLNRADADFLDSMSILIDSESSGQLVGSDEDIQQTLYFHLKKLGRATLVLDGIDECSSSTELLQIIHELCHDTGTKALLLSRPTLTLPSNFKYFVPLDLESGQNAGDIRKFLTPKIKHIHADGLLGKDAMHSQICSILTSKSQGMFLWAYLVIKYLKCEVLSPAERMEAIFVDGVIEGLEKVYGSILQALSRAFATERSKVRKMFELICVAKRPFKVTELRTILGINPGKVTRDIDLIVRFLGVLPKMSGSLVEVDPQGSVTFVHSSFRKFITSPDHWGRNDFAVNINEAHLSASTLCLSYLIYDAPQGPCSENNPPMKVILADLLRKFPLVIYAASFWVYHGELGITIADVFRGSSFTDHGSQFYSMLNKMLSQRISITSWIETSWLSGRRPSVQKLADALSKMSSFYSSDVGETKTVCPTVFQHLEEFSKDLELLNSEWSHELQGHPAAIWGPSITAFNKSLFWYRTIEVEVKSLAPPDISARKEFARELVLNSRSVEKDTSLLGAPLIGIVSVVPPMDHFTERSSSVTTNHGWKARYIIKFIDSGETLWNLEFDLPNEDISNMLQKWGPDRLQFPVAISKTLRKVAVLRSVFMIEEEDWSIRRSAANTPNTIIQRLELNTSSALAHKQHYYERFYFSDNENTIALGATKEFSCRHMIDIWSCHRSESTYAYRDRVIAYSQLGGSTGEFFVFHPSLECIIFTKYNEICLWLYNKPDVPIACWDFRFPVSPVAMQSYSVLKTSESYIDLADFFERAVPPHLREGSINQEQLGNESMGNHSVQSALIKTSSHKYVIPEKVLVHSASGGQSVVLRQQHLTSLPRLHNNESASVDVLPLVDGQDHITIVWNKEQQTTNSLSDPQSRHLPSIIKRRLDSRMKRALETTEEDTAEKVSVLQLPGDPKRIRLIENK